MVALFCMNFEYRVIIDTYDTVNYLQHPCSARKVQQMKESFAFLA